MTAFLHVAVAELSRDYESLIKLNENFEGSIQKDYLKSRSRYTWTVNILDLSFLLFGIVVYLPTVFSDFW